MGSSPEEPVYLATVKPKREKDIFADIVRQAFFLELNCTKDGQIAKAIRRSPGLVSSFLKSPGEKESEALSTLISPLRDEGMKRRIIRAWADARFGIDLLERTQARPRKALASQELLKRAKRYLVEGEPLLAASVAMDGVSKSPDRPLYDQLLDCAHHAYTVYDLSGKAMQVARVIVESGRTSGDARREARGYFNRLMNVAGMPDSKPLEVQDLLNDVFKLAAAFGPVKERPPYQIVTDLDLAILPARIQIGFMERGALSADRSELTGIATHLARLAETTPKKERFLLYFLLARTFLLLEETHAASEYLEKAYSSHSGGIYLAREICGLVEARIMSKTDLPGRTVQFLSLLSRNVQRRWDMRHLRSIENDLARLEAGSFPQVR